MSFFSKISQSTQKQFNQDEEQTTQSPQSMNQEIMMSIQSIQKFYNINSQTKLVHIIIDQKESAKLFNHHLLPLNSKTNTPDLYFNTEKEQKRINFFAQKYSYEGLVQKFPKPKSGTNQLLLKILQKKLQTAPISSHQTRKKIWLLASGAKFNMINNKHLYQNLLKYHDYPKYFERSITQDLHRTVSKHTSLQVEQDMSKLKNVLIAFSRRNPYIGYCQGLNFIAFFLLTMQFTQQEAFFLLSTMLESIIPMDYYTNMIGVVCDQQIFINILKVMKPHIIEKFDQLGLDPSILSIEWFVCLFTSSLPFYLVKIVWDRLLVQGTRAFMKTGLILLSYFQDSIMQATQFHEIIMILQKGSKNLQVSQTAFNAQFQKYYIDKKGLNIARNLYREYHIKEKLEDKVISKKAKVAQPKCNTKWPICVSKLEKLKRERQQIDVWIYRAQGSPKLIPDYLTNKSQNFQKKINITGTFIGQSQSNQDSFNDNIKMSVNDSEISISSPQKAYKAGETQQISAFSKKKPNTDALKNSKFEKSNDQVDAQKLGKKSKDLIIGRMEHICQKQVIEMEKIKKTKKSDLKFLSMMFSSDQEPHQVQEKRFQTYQKIAKASQIFAQTSKIYENDHQFQDHHQQSLSKNESLMNEPEKEKLERRSRNQLAQSQTINFYTEFMEKNKELSSIICGVQNINLEKQEPNEGEIVKEEEEKQEDLNEEQENSDGPIQRAHPNGEVQVKHFENQKSQV